MPTRHPHAILRAAAAYMAAAAGGAAPAMGPQAAPPPPIAYPAAGYATQPPANPDNQTAPDAQGQDQDQFQVSFTPSDLYDAIDHADDRMAPLRKLRREAIQEYGGRYWFEDDRRARVLNLTKRGVKVLVAHLAARNPRYEVTTERMQFRGVARQLSRALEIRGSNAGLAKFSRLCLLDAFFGGRAVVRVGERSASESYKSGDRFVHKGEVYRRRVSLDDWVIDPAARDDSEAFFEGERYRIPRARALAAVQQGIFGHDPADPLASPPAFAEDVATPDEARAMIEGAAAMADGRIARRGAGRAAADLTAGGVGDAERYALVDTIELIDIAVYIDAETCVLVTMLSERGQTPKYLRAEVWEGPTRGPFEHLEFDPVPDNLFGPSVASDMREQSEVLNTVVGRMVDQIKRTRRVLIYQKQRAADALKISKTPDGGTVGIDGNPSEMQAVDLGGLSAELAPFATMIVGYWNSQGSYDILGSQAGATKTATESSQLFTNANILVQALAEMHDDFHTRLVRHEAWYLLNDPFVNIPLTMRLNGGASIEVSYSAEQRAGTFEDYTFKIKPRSMQRVDPNVQTQRVIQIVQAAMLAAQAEQETGGRVDAGGVARLLGERFEEDNLDEILRDPMLMQQIAQDYAGVPGPQQGEAMGAYGPQGFQGAGGGPMGAVPRPPFGMAGGVPPNPAMRPMPAMAQPGGSPPSMAGRMAGGLRAPGGGRGAGNAASRFGQAFAPRSAAIA